MTEAARDPEEILDRPARPADRTVVYGPLPEHVADVWLPELPASLPLVVIVHGGFWKAAYDRSHVAPAAEALAAAGYPVATPEYRRVGAGGGWPGTFEDVAAAVAALPTLLSDVTTVAGAVLIGHSAGGQLVLWAGRTGSGVRGVVALAPVADMSRAYEMSLGSGAVAAVLGGGPQDVPDRYTEVDPAANLPLGVPTAIVHGRLDRVVPYAIGADFARESAAGGDTTMLIDIPDAGHFELIDPLTPAWHRVLAGLAFVCDAGEDSGRA
jgi:acetyl esterase/lipase